jgi:ABC-type sugar transport system permease subunit
VGPDRRQRLVRHPFFAITLLAALQAIPRELYEAAAIDGANAWQRFTKVTLPFLAPMIAITVLLRTIWISNFADLVVVMAGGGPANATQILPSYIFTPLTGSWTSATPRQSRPRSSYSCCSTR